MLHSPEPAIKNPQLGPHYTSFKICPSPLLFPQKYFIFFCDTTLSFIFFQDCQSVSKISVLCLENFHVVSRKFLSRFLLFLNKSVSRFFLSR